MSALTAACKKYKTPLKDGFAVITPAFNMTNAKCFTETFRHEYCNMSLPAAPGIERINVIVFGLKNTTLIPYILYVAKNVENQNELRKIYGIPESYLMKRMIVHAPTKNYNNS